MTEGIPEPAPIPPDVILSNPGDGWRGSFGIALAAFIEDVLSDGEPFIAWITWELDNGDEMYEGHWIESLAAGHIVVRHGLPIPLSEVTKLEA